ncbi:MAG: UDP-N-acetylmuramoyl-tripeptide--D-alanyl-D-alanine ligase [Bacteroidota bacterium]|nr:UDP-N-acetylmuramoyl-tripeptide--D-alanyl-D-alanine ligase [Bacteroidota bacterium]MDP4233974.1 UDP-N-acetylmuramoyl-tripeptide--D-alanyl-D-alanine ligase [Bacteroidota bacterium]MDP4242775.1 UDP-N-acetylmuramoyl-tripeptide--D-alanyl-D-alanine ligase [Bacteroidota bacterium]MDP4288489.1 UDP-N-acetylmuramoyl-tripeptide--D-alanyl-D-alanine ligase [Bacteroidota bacterium]
MNLTVLDLLSVPFVREIGLSELDPNLTFHDVSTDSRTVRQNDLFVALRGPNFDGHKFLPDVQREHAIAAIVSEEWSRGHKSKPGLPMLIVKDTLDALGALANRYRKKFNIPVLAIAGSNGKTTTKELVAHVLSDAFDVLKTEANFNNQIGVPRMLFQLRDGHGLAVLEIGTNHPGEIAWLCSVAEPTHVLVTNIGREHLEFFKDLKGVATEEGAAFEQVNARRGIAFVNMDDRYLRPAAKMFDDRCWTFGTHDEGRPKHVFAEKIATTKDGRMELRIGSGGKSFKVRTHLIADYAPNMVAAAIAVAMHFGLRRTEIKTQIEQFRPHTKRLEVVHTPDGVTILNDAYNANPDSMEAALRTLESFPADGRKIAVLGDMFELGATSEREHRALGRWVANCKLDDVFFTGTDMELAWKAYHTAGRQRDGAAVDSYFKTKKQLAMALRAILKPGDAVLIKGSRGMKMEELIEMLQRA